MKIKISPSLLQEFADTQNGKFEGTRYEKTNDTLIEYIMGEYQPNVHTSRGNAWHSLLEEGASTQVLEINPEWNKTRGATFVKRHEKEMGVDWYFGPELLNFATKWESKTATMSYELRGCLEMKLPGYEIYILYKCDALNLGVLHEFKTTQSNKGWSDFLDSLQWRLYMMDYPDVEFVMYHIFKMPRMKPEDFPVKELSNKAPNVIEKMDYNYFSFRRYTDMEADVRMRVQSFVGWLSGQDNRVKERLEANLDKINAYLSFA